MAGSAIVTHVVVKGGTHSNHKPVGRRIVQHLRHEISEIGHSPSEHFYLVLQRVLFAFERFLIDDLDGE